ncbi:hypothetical protein [Aestuariimicrobium kwangyangense]|uniref:hypothetical protein n=1 Tax=Aestuariimicrobium kwangyangense TaxID=396389 RepID=UPI0003B3AF9D|nr:hypothetical protein [Aestuariimicrobium kwangyangense]
MNALPACLAEPRLVAALPLRPAEASSLPRVGAVLEILAQRGFRTVSLHHGNRDWLAELVPVFGARLAFGLHGVVSPDELEPALAQTPAFVLANNANPALVRTGIDAGVTVLPAALTPNELLAASDLGAPAVQVLPADVMGGAYGESLQHVLPPSVQLVPRGGLGAWALGRWYKVGAACCVADDTLFADAFDPDGHLGQLRERCGSFVEQVPEPLG